MNCKYQKQAVRKVLAVSIAAIGLAAPFAAAAEDDEIRRMLRPESEIEVGVGHVSSDSFKFGDYTGLNESGSHLIGNINYVQRGEKDARWLEIVGRNLGLDSRSLRAQGGEQGNYGLRLEYDQLPKLFSDSYQTPFVNPGSTSLVLPTGWVAGATTATMTNLNASMRRFDVETLRKSISLGLTKLLPAGWEVAVDFKRENRDGNRLIGGVIGNSGGNPRAAVLPEPVDYTTDQFEAVARYATPTTQLQVGYYGSFFKNANRALAWQNPYTNAPWGGAPVGYANGGFGQLALPPDNQFHQINATGGYSFSKDTRLSGSLSFGRMTQDESFLPYTVNPNLAVGVPLPRSSLDGKVNTTHADLRLTSRLTPKWHLTTVYRYDDSDNRTPQAQYWYIGGDSQTQAAAGGGKVRTNLPVGSTKQQIAADLDYHLAARTRLKLGYEFDWVKKTYEAIDWEREHTAKVGVDHHFGDTASAGVSYAYSDRDTSTYNASAPFLASYTDPAYIAAQAATGLWDNVPTQKKFFLAPRTRDKLRAYANVSPADRLDLQFSVDYKSDDYHTSEFGLKDATGWGAHFDANLAATDELTSYVFASLENYETGQRSAQLGAVKANYLNPGFAWVAEIEDRTATFGLGLRYKPGGRYEFGGDFSHAYSNGNIKVTTGALLTPAKPLPDLVSRLNRLELFGKYWVQKDISVNLRYIHERYRSEDWGYDQVYANTIANVIGTNQTSPDYRVNYLGVAVAFRFF